MITPSFIITEVCRSYDVSRSDVLSRRRHRKFTAPRHAAMYIIKEKSSLSYPAIGRIFDRDHTTVVHVCRQIRRRDINRDLLYLLESNTKVVPEVRVQFEKSLDMALDDFKRALCVRIENDPIGTLGVLAKALKDIQKKEAAG